ncbi:MAG: hypothetical protein R3D55_03570 [Chloroflexota bacterium]
MDKLRYEKLSEGEESMSSLYVTYPVTTPEAWQKGKILAEKVRQECKNSQGESLEDGMKLLRGRSWQIQ